MAGRTPLSELLIVDADVHVHESPGALAPYIDPPWDVALRSIADVPERYLDIPGFDPNFTPWAVLPTIERRTTVTSPAQLREDLDLLGVNVPVLFPDSMLLHALIKPPAYAVALGDAAALRERAAALLRAPPAPPLVTLLPTRAGMETRMLELYASL